MRLIPKGRDTNYDAVVKYLGIGLSSPIVGWAMNAALSKPEVPAHRVVNRIGLLTGKMHFVTPKLMQELLEKEGVKVDNDKVMNFKEIYWDPMHELQV